MVIANSGVIRTLDIRSVISFIIVLGFGVIENTASLNIAVCIEDSSDSLVHIISLFVLEIVTTIIHLFVDVTRPGPSDAISNAEGSVLSESLLNVIT